MSEADERIKKKLRRELGVISKYLDDKAVIEIMANPNGSVWVERMGSGMVHECDITPSAVRSIINTLSAYLATATNSVDPVLEGELPLDGSRFEGLIPPIVTAPSFTLRKRAMKVFTLDQYVDDEIMSQEQRQVIDKGIEDRKNIIISGGTGSGKTTLTNAIIAGITEIHPADRIVTIEDTYELQCSAPNAVPMHSTAEVDMQRLLKITMRMRPDRIIVGEVRGAEALALLKAWNTGHPGGCATLHANSPTGALTRLHHLTAEGVATSSHIPELIAEAVNIVVQIAKTTDGRKITGMCEVHSYENNEYQFSML